MRILIVENTGIIALDMRRTLVEEGHDVVCISGLSAFIKYIDFKQYDVVIVEAVQLKEEHCAELINIPLILSITDERLLDNKLTKNLLIANKLYKPFGGEKLIQIVKQLNFVE